MHNQSYASLLASKAPIIEQKCKKTMNAQKTLMVVFSHASQENTLETYLKPKKSIKYTHISIFNDFLSVWYEKKWNTSILEILTYPLCDLNLLIGKSFKLLCQHFHPKFDSFQ